jgi:mannosyl-oligosaccharide alpha-1,2-mannosidase
MLRQASRHPITFSKLLCGVFIVTFYIIYSQLNPPALTKGQPLPKRQSIQFERWRNNTGKADVEKKNKVKEAMAHTFRGYKSRAWGTDDIKPVTGGTRNSRNGWGAFIVDSSTTLSVMGMWEELLSEINFMIETDFTTPAGKVDVFETTIRYLGGLVSLVELGDAGVIPNSVMTASKRQGLVKQATVLADELIPAFDSRTGLPWPKIDFATGRVSNRDVDAYDEPTIGPARAGSNFLELCTLSKLTKEPKYCNIATKAWSSLVRNSFREELPGLVDSRINVQTGYPVGQDRSWDSGHDSYYEYLLKASLLLPDSKNAKNYQDRWIEAADAVRHNLTTRSAPSSGHFMSHAFMGSWSGFWYINEMSHLACFAPGNLILGGRHLQRPDLVTLGKALLETCRHVYKSSKTGLGPEKVSWQPSIGSQDATYQPQSSRQLNERNSLGFWVADPSFKLRPEYAESLFYAFRATGEKRYRDWAWDMFNALEKHCKTQFGYAGLEDVMVDGSRSLWIDHTESFWAAETLKYLYLIFDDVNVISLDDWIFTTEGHLVRRGR